MDIAEQPVSQHGAHARFVFQFSRRSNNAGIASRTASIAAARSARCADTQHHFDSRQAPPEMQASGDRGLKQFAVPVLWDPRAPRAGIRAVDDVGDTVLHLLESLPVAARRQRVAVLTVLCGGWIPVPCRTRSISAGVTLYPSIDRE